MSDIQGSDITALKSIFSKLLILDKLSISKKHPKLGIQLYKDRCDNQSCHILTVIFNLITQLRFKEYNVYNSNLFYTNITTST